MFGLGFPELIIIMIIVVLIFGAGKLPEIGGAIGKSIKGFKKAVSEPEGKETPLSRDDIKDKNKIS
jgi:sec-independent protein translocase protein TatA